MLFVNNIQMNQQADHNKNQKQEQMDLSKVENQNRKKQALEIRSFKKKRATMKTSNYDLRSDGQTQPNQRSKEKQQKLTIYFHTNSKQPSKNNSTLPHSIPSEAEVKINNLEDILKSKDQELEKLKIQRQAQQHKYSTLYFQKRQYSKQTKNIIAKCMKEMAQLRRKERGQIYPKLGYFKNGSLTIFVQGEQIQQLRRKINEKQGQIKTLQLQKKGKSPGSKKQKNYWIIDRLAKELTEFKEQFRSKEKQLNNYKQRLRHSEKQSNCFYAKLDWPLIKDRFQTMELLGSGGFGQVYKCFDLEANEIVALKVNRFNINEKDQNSREEFFKHVHRQVKIQQDLNHPQIAKFIQLIEISQSCITFVLEYCEGPQLSKYLKKQCCLQEKQAKGIVKQLLQALKYLNSLDPKVIHYDLKPSNIMFHKDTVKILDFGLCKIIDTDETRMELTSQGVGTYWYLPPETFAQRQPKVCSKVDIWSVGVIFYELLYGKKPFGHGISQNKIFNQGIILNAKAVQFPAQTPKKYKVSQAAKNFISSCLKYSVQERLDADQAVNHSYFQK